MLGNCLTLHSKQIDHLLLREPDRVVINANFILHSIVKLIEHDSVLSFYESFLGEDILSKKNRPKMQE